MHINFWKKKNKKKQKKSLFTLVEIFNKRKWMLNSEKKTKTKNIKLLMNDILFINDCLQPN